LGKIEEMTDNPELKINSFDVVMYVYRTFTSSHSFLFCLVQIVLLI